MKFILKKYETHFLALILVVVIFLLFSNLGDRFFGTDETYVALRVKEVLEHGYPGDEEVSFTTPLHIYVVSISSMIFGLNEFSLRIISEVSTSIISSSEQLGGYVCFKVQPPFNLISFSFDIAIAKPRS